MTDERSALIRLSTSIVFLFFLSFPLNAENNFSKKNSKIPPISSPRSHLFVGEDLRYNVYWLGIPIGLGRLSVLSEDSLEGGTAYHLMAYARTNDFLTKIYPVWDEIHSWMDTSAQRSYAFSKTVSEGRYRADEKIQYDYKKMLCFYESLKNGSKKEIPIPGDVHDFLSAFYWFRMQPANVGKKLETVINSEEKNWPLELHVLSHSYKEIRGAGSFYVLEIEPKTKAKGALHDRGRMWVYFTADAKRIPVYFKVQTPWGLVTATLDKEKSIFQ